MIYIMYVSGSKLPVFNPEKIQIGICNDFRENSL